MYKVLVVGTAAKGLSDVQREAAPCWWGQIDMGALSFAATLLVRFLSPMGIKGKQRKRTVLEPITGITDYL